MSRDRPRKTPIKRKIPLFKICSPQILRVGLNESIPIPPSKSTKRPLPAATVICSLRTTDHPFTIPSKVDEHTAARKEYGEKELSIIDRIWVQNSASQYSKLLEKPGDDKRRVFITRGSANIKGKISRLDSLWENHQKARSKIAAKDFTTIKVIGKGGFGEVRLVMKKDDGQVFAMKTMRKKDIIERNKVDHVKAERDLLSTVDNPWLVKLHWSFQDSRYLYLVMEYCGGGDLMMIFMRWNTLTESQTRFYISEIACAINSLHKLKFVHRDLKPDNVLISNQGHVKLGDFGLSRRFNTEWIGQSNTSWERYRYSEKPESKRQSRPLMFSALGTLDYIAPEVLSRKGYRETIDWWSLGVIMFEALVGYSPFCADKPLHTCRKILNFERSLSIPTDIRLSPEARDVIYSLICSANKRLDYDGIVRHPFFKGCNWENLMVHKPPFSPDLNNNKDTRHFESVDFKESSPIQIVIRGSTPSRHKRTFTDFTFSRRGSFSRRDSLSRNSL